MLYYFNLSLLFIYISAYGICFICSSGPNGSGMILSVSVHSLASAMALFRRREIMSFIGSKMLYEMPLIEMMKMKLIFCLGLRV